MSPTGWTEAALDVSGNIRRLRRQRNLAAVVAVIIVVAGMAVSLPRALERRRQLKEADAELIGLQSRIVEVQNRIRDVQARIGPVQAEIGKLTKERR